MSLIRALNNYLSRLPIGDRRLAQLICRLVPSACPFERDFRLLGYTLFHIPPLCKLNPFYEGLIVLRFHALSCLVDGPGEGVT